MRLFSLRKNANKKCSSEIKWRDKKRPLVDVMSIRSDCLVGNDLQFTPFLRLRKRTENSPYQILNTQGRFFVRVFGFFVWVLVSLESGDGMFRASQVNHIKKCWLSRHTEMQATTTTTTFYFTGSIVYRKWVFKYVTHLFRSVKALLLCQCVHWHVQLFISFTNKHVCSCTYYTDKPVGEITEKVTTQLVL